MKKQYHKTVLYRNLHSFRLLTEQKYLDSLRKGLVSREGWMRVE